MKEIPGEIPASEQQRAQEESWLKEHLPAFWNTAQGGYHKSGPGALVIDSRGKSLDEETPFYYVPQTNFVAQEDEISQQLADWVAEYDPAQQLVAVIIRPDDDTTVFSIYQIAVNDALAESRGSY